MRLRRLITNIIIDIRYGGRFLGGSVPSPTYNLGMWNTVNSDYRALSEIFKLVTIKPTDVIVDIGCGKGRLFNFLLWNQYKNRMIGIEYNPIVAKHTRNRLRRYSNITIIEGNAVQVLPADSTLLYLFNPFGESIMEKFIERLLTDFTSINIIYKHPKDIHLFDTNLWEIDMNESEAIPDKVALIRKL